MEAQLVRVSTSRARFRLAAGADQAANDVAECAGRCRRSGSKPCRRSRRTDAEERAIADADVQAAASALAVLERRLNKTILRSPVYGVVSVIVAEIGENVRAGQPVLAITATGKQLLSFNAREDFLDGLTVGAASMSRRASGEDAGPVTEIRPLGTFATWQAERAVGDHDRNTFRLRLDLRGDPTGSSPACWSGSIVSLRLQTKEQMLLRLVRPEPIAIG